MQSVHELWGIRHFHLMLDAFFKWLFNIGYKTCSNCSHTYDDREEVCPNCGRIN